jgi:hypothetical protein
MRPQGEDIVELRFRPFLEIQWIEFLFVIIGYIINTFIYIFFDVSFSNGIIDYCVFVFDEVYLFIINNFVYNFFHSHDQ